MKFSLSFRSYFETLLQKSGITINGKNPWDIQIYDSSIYTDVLLKGSLGFGNGFVLKKWDVDSIDGFFERILLNGTRFAPSFTGAVLTLRDALINTQIGKRAFDVAHGHYDLGNDMYEYMLGESMGYSSGIFKPENSTLTQAQTMKFDTMCKKLRLSPGMKLLEIGSGWGSFAKHAAQNYGVEIISLTVSAEQKAYADKLCVNLPVEIKLLDYQTLDSGYTNYFDRVVSIEMIEAVGRKNFRRYFSVIEKVLKEDGLFGLQSILGSGKPDAFLSTRIFPNGLVPSQEDILNNCKNLLRIKNWESIGADYDKTLMAWDSNFKKNWELISQLTDKNGSLLYDEEFYRMWRYYLLLCAASFRTGVTDCAQIIMSKLNTKSPYS
jgi:cyclopropane-fatty-acyl-phospholipid synthase